ncbi:[protein-PII] uridylyltransferase [Streptomyces sp. P38-E01]|uniref:Bifunctional uridylyltransferase/uridylyl-removing enzyme n=1 Tax=Streptomyces tardus TaxID=2780544 RepID=A0A949JCS8_9ACTN|nr:[protein-PII] uridylyltransferase [Streptomyces tardus]MBU7596145.1 [protein-PII] uridylyltransferase [Streptomyces tardus]
MSSAVEPGAEELAHAAPERAGDSDSDSGSGSGAVRADTHRADAHTRTVEPDYAEARLRLLRQQDDPLPQGRARRAALAALTDRWLASLLERSPVGGVALVAVGGYGRRELSPRSDLDLLLLHDGTLPTGELTAVADRIWYPVWDLGLDLDHSVRTPEQARGLAAVDLKVQLGLLDARHLAGDAGLTARLRTEVLGQWRNLAAQRLPQLRELALERSERHGELQYLLEPDLKEAHGGLRDTTVLRAVAASWLADAPRAGLPQAGDTLLDVRDALQLTTGRAGNRLGLHEQDQVAAALGLLDADVLLRRVYEAARAISFASEVTWREVGRVLRARRPAPIPSATADLAPHAPPSSAPDPNTPCAPYAVPVPLRDRWPYVAGGDGRPPTGGRGRRPAIAVPLAEGVVEQDGEAVLTRTARPGRDPGLVLRAAAAAARAGVPPALATVRRLAREGAALPTPWPAEARENFVALLGAGRALLPVWDALESEGLVCALLPDWERVRCRPQRNAVHRWTVDRHLVETVVEACALTRRVSRPDLLLVGALLHDIGKGWPGNHSVTGETIARDMAARMGFGAADTEVLGRLVRHHLLLVETATRCDPDDPGTVAAVAQPVGDRGTLELLHALTEADARATGPGAWSKWRAGLVADLVRRTAASFDDRPAEEAAVSGPGPHSRRLAAEVGRTGRPALVLLTPEQPESVAPDPSGPGRSAPAATPPGPAGVELLMAVPGRPTALSTAAGVLARHRITVRSAELTVSDAVRGTAVTLLSWRVLPEYGALPPPARLRADLVRAWDGSLDVAVEPADRGHSGSTVGRARPAPRVSVLTGDTDTVVEVRAADGTGLLRRLAAALETYGVVVRAAYVSTLGADAVDTFRVTGRGGAPLSPCGARALAEAVERAAAV